MYFTLEVESEDETFANLEIVGELETSMVMIIILISSGIVNLTT